MKFVSALARGFSTSPYLQESSNGSSKQGTATLEVKVLNYIHRSFSALDFLILHNKFCCENGRGKGDVLQTAGFRFTKSSTDYTALPSFLSFFL